MAVVIVSVFKSADKLGVNVPGSFAKTFFISFPILILIFGDKVLLEVITVSFFTGLSNLIIIVLEPVIVTSLTVAVGAVTLIIMESSMSLFAAASAVALLTAFTLTTALPALTPVTIPLLLASREIQSGLLNILSLSMYQYATSVELDGVRTASRSTVPPIKRSYALFFNSPCLISMAVAGILTVTLQDNDFVFLEGYVITHLIVAVPVPTAVTIPFVFTLATLLLEVVHLYLLLATLLLTLISKVSPLPENSSFVLLKDGVAAAFATTMF